MWACVEIRGDRQENCPRVKTHHCCRSWSKSSMIFNVFHSPFSVSLDIHSLPSLIKQLDLPWAHSLCPWVMPFPQPGMSSLTLSGCRNLIHLYRPISNCSSTISFCDWVEVSYSYFEILYFCVLSHMVDQMLPYNAIKGEPLACFHSSFYCLIGP